MCSPMSIYCLGIILLVFYRFQISFKFNKNILFKEAIAFSKNILGVETEDTVSIAKAISNMSSVSEKKRVVVITQGADPIIVATGLYN